MVLSAQPLPAQRNSSAVRPWPSEFQQTDSADFIGIFIVQVGPNNLVSLQLVSALAAVIGTTVPSGYQVSAAGIAGQAAYTTTGLTFNVAAGLGATSVIFASTAWMAAGQVILISDPANSNQFAHYSVYQILSNSVALLTYLGYAGDTTIVGDTVNVNSLVVCSGPQAAIGSLPSAIVDSSGGTPSATVPATVGIFTLSFFLNLADISNADSITSLVLGYNFKILSMKFVVEKAATTAAKLATLTPYINGSIVTGGVLALTSANCTPKGAVVSASNITALNSGTNAQGFSITGSSVTTFIEGAGWLVLEIQNTDDVTALSSLAAAINQLITAL